MAYPPHVHLLIYKFIQQNMQFQYNFLLKSLYSIYLITFPVVYLFFPVNTSSSMDFLKTLLLTVTFLSYFAHTQISSDTIKPGGVILPSEMLVLERFGFQSMLGGAAYLVILYLSSVVGSYTVWVVNERNFLVNGNLTMEEDGVLKIFYDEGSPVILNPNRATPNSIGTIEHFGNFRVKEPNPDGSIRMVL
jgi:hypothetical protein